MHDSMMQTATLPVTFAVEALRGVGNVALELRPDQRAYVLFGSNGVGKTKCLEAMFQFELFTNTDFVKSSGGMTPSNLFVARHYARAGHGSFDTPREEYVLGRLVDEGFSGLHMLPVVFVGAGHRSAIDDQQVAPSSIGTFAQRKEQHFSELLESMQSRFSSLGMHTSVQQWFVTLAYSANPYQKQVDSRKVEIDTLLQLLHAVDARFDPTFLQISGDNRVSLKVHGQITELRHLSSGFASLLKMLQAIVSGYANFTNEVQLTQVRGTVFIDEIESHLHVDWQSKIVLLLKKLFPHTTFYIATHAPLVLTQLEEGEAYRLHRDADGVVRTQLIHGPNKQTLADVLDEGFGVNVNALKRERMSADSQQAAKLRLLALLNSRGDVP